MRTKNPILIALGLITIAMVIIGFIDNFVRQIAEDAGLWQFHAVRALMVAAILVPVLALTGWDWRPKRLWAVTLRSAVIAISMYLYFGALGVMPAALAGAGLFTSPIWVLLITVLVFRAPVGLFRVLAVAVGFLGVLLILRPGDGLGLTALMPVAAGAFYAAGAVMTRRLCADETTTAMLTNMFATMGVFGVIGLAVMTFGVRGDSFFTIGWQPLTATFLGLTLMQAVGSLVAVACIVRSYQIAEPSYVAVFEFLFLLFAVFWGFVLWGDLPDALGFAGLALIVLAGSVIVLRSGTSETGEGVPDPSAVGGDTVETDPEAKHGV